MEGCFMPEGPVYFQFLSYVWCFIMYIYIIIKHFSLNKFHFGLFDDLVAPVVLIWMYNFNTIHLCKSVHDIVDRKWEEVITIYSSYYHRPSYIIFTKIYSVSKVVKFYSCWLTGCHPQSFDCFILAY